MSPKFDGCNFLYAAGTVASVDLAQADHFSSRGKTLISGNLNIKFIVKRNNDNLKFAAINYETKENKYFIEKYPLNNKHIILSQRQSNDKKTWRELDKIWYVAHDETIFKNYLEKEIRNFIKSPGTTKKE